MFQTIIRGLRCAPIAAAFALPSFAHAQLVPDWSASVAAQVVAPALAVDGGRNSVVAATLLGLPVVVHKFGPTGTELWQRSLAGAGVASRAFDVVTDATGSIVLGGAVVDATGMPLGTLVAKLDAAGNTLWQDAATTAPAQVREVALDASGNVYALVQAGTAATGPELQLVKYSAGGVRQWMRTYGASTTNGLDSLVINSAGQPVVTGSNSAGQAVVAAFDGLGNPLAVINTGTAGLSLAAGRSGEVYAVGGGSGLLAIKYGPAFNELWRTTVSTSGTALRAAVDATGNLVMTGSFNLPSSGGISATVITPNWRTAKLSTAGAPLWSVDFGVSHFVMGSPAALGLGIDGSVFVTGRAAEPVTGSTGTVSYRPSMATIKYTVAGALEGTLYTNSSQVGADVEVASDGGVYVAGEANLFSGTPAPLLHIAGPVLAPAKPSALLVTGPVWESSSATATVTLSTAAGATVKLSSSNTSAAKVPASVVVPAGATSVSFPVTTLAVRRNTAVTIRATANGTTLGTAITVLNR
ncbi:hypothetical protein [Hydrogenophaga sp. RWCD_12]|uniref:hypothetical protein n=1 Tax=Hydrogenophaga sp. RWCD_12 TaxID=3391190 RepID=UPI003984CBA0